MGRPMIHYGGCFTTTIALALSSITLLLLTATDGFTAPPCHTAPRVTTTTTTTTMRGAAEDRKERVDDAFEEANDALASVGWARPTTTMTDDEMTSDDPFVRDIDAGIRRDFGVGLDDLLNPAKVVNLERDLYNLRLELADVTGGDDEDGGGGDVTKGEEADKLRASIQKKETSLSTERRAVFRGWLKNVFLGQAVLSLGLSWVMVTNPVALFGGFEGYENLQLDTSIRVLGFWWWWLFIVPSLRSRRPGGTEKKALDIAFLGTPLISILSPVVTKDTPTIWLANLAVVLGAYGYAFFIDTGDDDDDDDNDNNNNGKPQPKWLRFIYRSLDFGVGQERGARS